MTTASRFLDFEKYRRRNGVPEFVRKPEEDPTELIAKKLGARVWGHLPVGVRDQPERCWPWTGQWAGGHPVLYVADRAIPAATILWRLVRPGESLDGWWVERLRGRCDDRRCANPFHYERVPKPRTKEID